MAAAEQAAFQAALTTFVPGGAAIAGLMGVFEAIGGGTEPAFRLEIDPWGRGNAGYGVEVPTARRLATLRGVSKDDQFAQRLFLPTGVIGVSMEGALPNPLALEYRVKQALRAAAVERGDPFRLDDSAVLVNIGSAFQPDWHRVNVPEALHSWPGSSYPIQISALETLGLEVNAAQDALSLEDGVPSFWWIDRRTWEGGGARQTWEESVPILYTGAPGLWRGRPAYTLEDWTAGTAPGSAAARAAWDERVAAQLEQYENEVDAWRAWKAERQYQAEVAAYYAEAEAAALEAYQAALAPPSSAPAPPSSSAQTGGGPTIATPTPQSGVPLLPSSFAGGVEVEETTEPRADQSAPVLLGLGALALLLSRA